MWSMMRMLKTAVFMRLHVLQLKKMRTKRMISGLRFIRRWRWGAFRCGWSGAPHVAFTDHRAVHTAPCVTTVWRYMHIHHSFTLNKHVFNLMSKHMYACVFVFRRLTITAHGWTTALEGGIIVISFCSCSRSLFTLWMCLASVCCTSSITLNSWTRSAL